MYVKKNFTLRGVLAFSWFHIVWISAWSLIGPSLFYFIDPEWLDIPWLPISIVATAVAFYIGFKNNSSYDRLWEARKIWGAIINSSRMWGAVVRSYVSDQFDPTATETTLKIHSQDFAVQAYRIIICVEKSVTNPYRMGAREPKQTCKKIGREADEGSWSRPL
jgi:putative membrane protein